MLMLVIHEPSVNNVNFVIFDYINDGFEKAIITSNLLALIFVKSSKLCAFKIDPSYIKSL